MHINRNGSDGFRLDVEVYSSVGIKSGFNIITAQARYLVHGIDDVLWTDSIEDVLAYFREELKRLEILAPNVESFGS
jgi:hypothetical protein